MDPAHFGLRLASGAVGPLITRLFRQDGPGAGLVDQPVRVSSLVSFAGETRTLTEHELRKLTGRLVQRAVQAAGPHDPVVPEDEQEALTGAVVRTLTGLGDLTMDDAHAVGLGHEQFARQLRARTPEATRALSADAARFHDRLIDTASLHILHFFTQRSTFIPSALVEQTRMLRRLIALTDSLLGQLPPSLRVQDLEFEERYGRYLVGKHSLLTIYGIDLDHAREWPLDAAYLSLEAVERRPWRGGGGGTPPDEDDQPPAPQPAERALAGRERVLLRGVAGSGKTTLVQWLAVTTARQELGEGMQHLRGRVPFVLPLRTLTRSGKELPAPAAFLTAVGCPLSPPPGWAERVLSAGRGLLLIDGLDEVPEQEREHARRWLRELLHAFPGNLWLVTARPSAVREGWLSAEDFSELSLTQMSRDDVAAFIRRWHRAVRADPLYEVKLLDAVRLKPDLGRLATNPLMCGLICALHRERRGYLPRGRKALYDAALTMLLERRDRERDMGSPSGVELDAEAQVQLLQKLAYWLIRNGRSEMDQEVAVGLLERVLPSMPHVGAPESARAVYRHLLDRSGLLREPSPGAVDFVHRTFQDYLGAKEAVEEQDFPLLVDHAHLDQWEDVIRMAVAHCRPEERARLLRALVARGDADAEQRVRLHLLAMACLEHATQLDPTVRKLAEQRASEVMPPRTLGEAESLAAVGPVALELLPGPEELTDEEARAVVVTAGRIATDAALTKLARFAHHPGRGVRNQLAWAWNRFDATHYATEIIRHLPEDDSWYLVARTQEELRVFHEVVDHAWLHVLGDFDAEDIMGAVAGKRITRLNIRDNSRLTGLSCLSALPHLESLALVNCPAVTDLRPLTGVPGLTRVTLEACQGLRSLEPLDRVRRLDMLHLRLTQPLDPPERAPLHTFEPPPTVPLTRLAAWPRLRHLALQSHRARPSPEEWDAVAALPELESLALTLPQLRALELRAEALPRITHLYLHPPDEGAGLERLPRLFPGLAHLTMRHPRHVDLTPLVALGGLRSVVIEEAESLRGTDRLAGVELSVEHPSRY
ncbi:NACHT domain-containing protein [Streptomyces sp. ACA25]|uniref:NACHT domain-containing protein n=1 Tax=Streptomyces sp. ACA25 TaxID=3022596 RepID=UPI002307F7FC|nr:NACHT domain-containing protein [Streptomyces sp. ACA25]MDB1086669.1 NACHT domain-containing protein [Streptomyces sp. ACA25]